MAVALQQGRARWLISWLWGSSLGVFLGVAVLAATYLTVPTQNTERTHFDTLIVLGCPADPDGRPSPDQRTRVMTAVQEYKTGRAAHMILSGAAAHNQYVEAETMAHVAHEAGVPESALVLEPHALNTVQNLSFSYGIMQARGWHSAEVVSEPNHLPRAGLLLARYPIEWRTVAAPWPPNYPPRLIVFHYWIEVLATNWIRWFGFRPSPYLPKA